MRPLQAERAHQALQLAFVNDAQLQHRNRPELVRLSQGSRSSRNNLADRRRTSVDTPLSSPISIPPSSCTSTVLATRTQSPSPRRPAWTCARTAEGLRPHTTRRQQAGDQAPPTSTDVGVRPVREHSGGTNRRAAPQGDSGPLTLARNHRGAAFRQTSDPLHVAPGHPATYRPPWGSLFSRY